MTDFVENMAGNDCNLHKQPYPRRLRQRGWISSASAQEPKRAYHHSSAMIIAQA